MIAANPVAITNNTSRTIVVGLLCDDGYTIVYCATTGSQMTTSLSANVYFIYLVQERCRQKDYAFKVQLDWGSNPWHPDHGEYISYPWDAHLNHSVIRDLTYNKRIKVGKQQNLDRFWVDMMVWRFSWISFTEIVIPVSHWTFGYISNVQKVSNTTLT